MDILCITSTPRLVLDAFPTFWSLLKLVSNVCTSRAKRADILFTKLLNCSLFAFGSVFPKTCGKIHCAPLAKNQPRLHFASLFHRSTAVIITTRVLIILKKISLALMIASLRKSLRPRIALFHKKPLVPLFPQPNTRIHPL